jgi:hypothetical protein
MNEGRFVPSPKMGQKWLKDANVKTAKAQLPMTLAAQYLGKTSSRKMISTVRTSSVRNISTVRTSSVRNDQYSKNEFSKKTSKNEFSKKYQYPKALKVPTNEPKPSAA